MSKSLNGNKQHVPNMRVALFLGALALKMELFVRMGGVGGGWMGEWGGEWGSKGSFNFPSF